MTFSFNITKFLHIPRTQCCNNVIYKKLNRHRITRRFIAANTKAHSYTRSWLSSFLIPSLQPVILKCILTLLFPLLDPASGCFITGFTTKIIYTFLVSVGGNRDSFRNDGNLSHIVTTNAISDLFRPVRMSLWTCIPEEHSRIYADLSAAQKVFVELLISRNDGIVIEIAYGCLL
jgi:hypothetical protein